jgi:hypothetical protein
MLDLKFTNSSFLSKIPSKKGIDKTQAYSWENGGLNSTEIFINHIIAGKILRRFGYESCKVLPNPFLLLYYFISLPLKFLFSFISHIKGYENIQGVIKKCLSPLFLKNKNKALNE